MSGSGIVRARVLGAAFLVVVAGGAGWLLAGSPADATAVVPPACPPSADPAVPSWAGTRSGVAEQLVPMPLPEPRGPVSARICRFEERGGRFVLTRSAVVEPVRTAALAGLMNGPARPLTGASPECAASGGFDVLLFRYTEGLPLRVDVLGGNSASVRTSARGEVGRQDVVLAVDGLLCGA